MLRKRGRARIAAGFGVALEQSLCKKVLHELNEQTKDGNIKCFSLCRKSCLGKYTSTSDFRARGCSATNTT
jgi:hypothetical protein